MTIGTLKARYARPDPKERKDPFDTEGRCWSRTLERRCPWCHEVFYAYQVVGKEQVPGIIEPERPLVPIPGSRDLFMPDGKRSTCGLDLCEKEEESAYLARHQGYQRASSGTPGSATTSAPAAIRGGLRRMS